MPRAALPALMLALAALPLGTADPKQVKKP